MYNVEDLKEVIERALKPMGKDTKGDDDFRSHVWKPSLEKAVKRIMPRFNSKSPFASSFKHFLKLNANTQKVDKVLPCHKLISGEYCTVCAFMESLGYSEAGKALWKILKPSLNALALVADVDSSSEDFLKFWNFGIGQYKKFIERFSDPDYSDFVSLGADGWNWKIYHVPSDNTFGVSLTCEPFKQKAFAHKSFSEDELTDLINTKWDYYDKVNKTVQTVDEVTSQFDEWVKTLPMDFDTNEKPAF